MKAARRPSRAKRPKARKIPATRSGSNGGGSSPGRNCRRSSGARSRGSRGSSRPARADRRRSGRCPRTPAAGCRGSHSARTSRGARPRDLARHPADRRARVDPPGWHEAHPGLRVALRHELDGHAAHRVGEIVVGRTGDGMGMPGEAQLVEARQELLVVLVTEDPERPFGGDAFLTACSGKEVAARRP